MFKIIDSTYHTLKRLSHICAVRTRKDRLLLTVAAAVFERTSDRLCLVWSSRLYSRLINTINNNNNNKESVIDVGGHGRRQNPFVD